jgi:transcriptional coactivator HFI1/ADA1
LLLTFCVSQFCTLVSEIPDRCANISSSDWELETRKRYQQPLASETGEFPDESSIAGRMLPICYEQGLSLGCADGTASFMNVANEAFIKEALSSVFGRVRSNGPNYMQTNRYRKQLDREEQGWMKGTIHRGVSGLLPIEESASQGRRTLGTSDVRLALEMGNAWFGQVPLVRKKLMGGYYEGEYEDEQERIKEDSDVDEDIEMSGMEVETTVGEMSQPGDDWGWEGGRAEDRDQLFGLLDDVLAVGQ